MLTASDWEGKLRVRLLVDLTRYHPALTVNAEGIVMEFEGKDKRTSDCERYWQVNFPEAGVWDIGPKGLEILDNDYLAWCEAKKLEREAEFLRLVQEGKISKVIYLVGPRGGFKSLTWSYPGGGTGRGDKKEAERLLTLFAQYQISVTKRAL
jgi:hypothetical protein